MKRALMSVGKGRAVAVVGVAVDAILGEEEFAVRLLNVVRTSPEPDAPTMADKTDWRPSMRG